MIDYNRLSVITNPYQGGFKRVLTVCSGGVLRSPTAAWVLSNDPWNYNTRCAGTEDYALVKLDEALLRWAQEIVVMTEQHETKVNEALVSFHLARAVVKLDIPDNFAYRADELVKLITTAYTNRKIA